MNFKVRICLTIETPIALLRWSTWIKINRLFVTLGTEVHDSWSPSTSADLLLCDWSVQFLTITMPTENSSDEIQCGWTRMSVCAVLGAGGVGAETTADERGWAPKQPWKILSTSSFFCKQSPMKLNRLFFLHLLISPRPPYQHPARSLVSPFCPDSCLVSPL